MQVFNQYSYLLGAAGMVVGAALLLYWLGARRPVIGAALLALVTALTLVWLVLRPGQSDITSASEAEAAINSGRPTLIEFYSNYCAGCLAARAAFDSLVAELRDAEGDAFNVLRVDIHTSSGRALRERYGFSYTPEFVLFDAGGEEVWRGHAPPTLTDLRGQTALASAGQSG